MKYYGRIPLTNGRFAGGRRHGKLERWRKSRMASRWKCMTWIYTKRGTWFGKALAADLNRNDPVSQLTKYCIAGVQEGWQNGRFMTGVESKAG
jgi:hypothetical protein